MCQGGGQLFTKFATLIQFYKSPMFPRFIILDANYYLITCKSSSLLWPFLRRNEDPDCRNPRGFRIATYKATRFQLFISCQFAVTMTHILI